MSISINDVEHVANLARLELSENDKKRFSEQLNSILDYAERLKALPTDDVEPTSHVLDITNVTRKDEVIASLDRDKALENAADIEDGHFRVPAILE